MRLARALAFFTLTAHRVMTGDGSAYKSRTFRDHPARVGLKQI